MNILIVDGNDKQSDELYQSEDINTQYEEYKNVLLFLSKKKLNIEIIHPAWNDNFIKQGLNLRDFEGIIWTGSALNIYDMTPSIIRQIELAKSLMQMKNKIFGSCWGLQILSTAAGGVVRKNPKGLEAVVGKEIQLNHEGIDHPMYKDKPITFDSFCWHYDEIEKLPENSKVLASNKFSKVQSLSFSRGESDIWAVQYHPEFNPYWVSQLMKIRKKILLESIIFKNNEEFDQMFKYLSNIEVYKNFKSNLDIKDSLIDNNIRYIEIKNWLRSF